MEYKIVAGKGPGELIEHVNAQIKLGWKPQGGVCRDDYYFYQAMIKE